MEKLKSVHTMLCPYESMLASLLLFLSMSNCVFLVLREKIVQMYDRILKKMNFPLSSDDG